jgi:hypothetical protein
VGPSKSNTHLGCEQQAARRGAPLPSGRGLVCACGHHHSPTGPIARLLFPPSQLKCSGRHAETHQPCASARRPCCSGLPGPTCPSTDLLLAGEREASVVQSGEPLPRPLENGLPAARHCCTLAVADVRVTNHGPRTSGLLFQRTLLSWFGAFSNTFVDQDYQTGPT